MLNDQDIELLEMHLDGALTEAEVATLNQRLATEIELAQELKRIELARQSRLQVWQSFEQPEPDTDRMLARIQAKVARKAWYVRLLDKREWIGAAAACIAVFLIGWQWGQHADAFRMGKVQQGMDHPVSYITQQQLPANNGQQVFEVQVTDNDGNIVRKERFQSLQEAQKFIHEIQLQLQHPVAH